MPPQWINTRLIPAAAVCWALLLIMTDGAEENRCVSPQSPTNPLHLSCPQSKLLLIKKVVIAKTETNVGDDFCDNPWHLESCEQNMEVLTEAGRRECNMVARCNMSIPTPPSDTCGPQYNGHTYIHVEYSCLARETPTTPALTDCDSLGREEMSNQSFLYSSRYPGGWQTGSPCSCNLQLRHQVYVTVQVLELTHNSTVSTQQCPFYLHMSLGGMNWTVCAKKAGTFTPTIIGPFLMREDSVEYLNIEIKTGATNIGGRFWLEISAYHKDHGSVPAMLFCQPRPTPPAPSATQSTTLPLDGATIGEVSQWTTSGNVSTSHHPPPQPQTLQTDLRIIIGGAIAGAAVVLLLVILLAVCIERKRRSVQKERDLAYICHANFAVANKLSKKLGSLRHPPMGVKQLSLQLLDQPPVESAPHHSGARQSGRGARKPHTYKNVTVTPETRQSTESLAAYTTSLTTLTPHSDDSARRKPTKAMRAHPYINSDVFSSFPRWATNNHPKDDTSRDSLQGSDRGSYTQTLPSKFKAATAGLRATDFRPKPLPKPKRGGNANLGSSTQSIVNDSSMDIYSKPHKHKRGITIVENDFYRT